MPLFEYACPDCAHIFEELTASSDRTPKPCPKCASPKAERILSATRKCGGKSGADALAGTGRSSQGCAPGGFS